MIPDTRGNWPLWETTIHSVSQGLAEIIIHPEGGAGFDGVAKEVPAELLVVGDAVGFLRSVLGAAAVGDDQFAVRQCLEVIEPELADFLHHGVGVAFEVFLVLGKRVVIPEVLGDPG